MYLVNQFGRVVDLDDQATIDSRIADKSLRMATDSEIASHLAKRQSLTAGAGDIYYQTVRQTPDGYGMSRDHIKDELYKLGLTLGEAYMEQKVGFLYNHPYSILSMRNDVRLIYTMFESDKIPEDWPDYLKVADEVLVPSKWCADVFAKSGVEATVVPLGYNDNAFKFIDRPIPIEQSKPFTFIHYNSFDLRKGFQEVYQAFTQEFDKSENVRLVLKTTRNHTPIPIVKSEHPQIDIERGIISEKELSDLVGTANCMVYPSRGEGFGITPLEAMATGLPAIVPNQHGISEYFNSKYMLEVKATDRCPGLYGKYRGQDVGEMVVCDVDDLRKQMRYAFNNQAEMKELGRSASEYAKIWTYRHTAERLAEIIKRWQKTEVTHRKDSKFLQVDRV